MAVQLLRRLLDESDVVAFQQDLSDVLLEVRLDVHLFDVVQNEVHVFIKADDDAWERKIKLIRVLRYFTFKANVDDVVEPNLNADFFLEEAKNKVDGLNHHLLDFMTITAHDSEPSKF